MNLNIPPQSSFFYKGRWTQRLDKMLLSTIIRRNAYRRGVEGLVTDEVILEAEGVIAREIGLTLTADELKLRLKFLRARYKTFQEVLATHGTRWDVDINVIVAEEEVWKLIFKRNHFARAYYHRDEPEFYLLATVFGLTDVKEEDETELVILLDSSEAGIPIPAVQTHSLSDTEEVNSPVITSGAKVRRKLFHDDSHPIGCQSSNVAPICYRASYTYEGLNYKVENNPPCRSIPAPKRLPKMSPGGSSCASWSPYPTSRKTEP